MSQSFQQLNFDMIEKSINDIAHELERGTGSTADSSDGSQSPKAASKPIQLPAAHLRSYTESINTEKQEKVATEECLLRTKSGDFKRFNVIFTEDMITFQRPESQKKRVYSYLLSEIHCLKGSSMGHEIMSSEGS